MSKNINKVFIANPITTNLSTDLMYFGRSPYGATDDAGMTYANFSAQFTLKTLTSAHIFVGNGSNVATDVALSGDATIANTGALTVASIGGKAVSLANSFTTSGNFTVTQTYTGATNVTFPTTGTLATTSQLATPAALTKTDDTNVTLTLGGTPATALLQATSITAGWTGFLGLTRGGTAASLTASTGGIVYSGASALAILSGTATANLPLLSGATAAPTWASFALSLGGALTTAGALTTSGAFGVTFTFTNTTSVTFPTSGTLATTTQIVTNNNVTGTSASMAISNLYVANNVGLVTLTLPSTAAVGDRVFVRGSGAGGWSIAQNASGIIHVGSSASTTGVGGSVASSNRYDCIDLTCIVANNEWVSSGVQGNLTVV